MAEKVAADGDSYQRPTVSGVGVSIVWKTTGRTGEACSFKLVCCKQAGTRPRCDEEPRESWRHGDKKNAERDERISLREMESRQQQGSNGQAEKPTSIASKQRYR